MANDEIIRCPRCRTLAGAWAQGETFDCACGLRVNPPKHDPAPAWEARADRRPPSWDPFGATFGLERWAREQDDLIAESERDRARQAEISDIEAMMGDERYRSRGTSALEDVLVGICAGFKFGISAGQMLDKSSVWQRFQRVWYRKNPRRSPFKTIGAALRFWAGELGYGPTNLRIAESKVHGRPTGFKNGRIHSSPSHNGCTGGSKNAVAIELIVDVERAIKTSGISSEDVALLRVAYQDHERKKPDYRAATIAALRFEGLLGNVAMLLRRPGDVFAGEEVDKLVEQHQERITKRLSRAARALEKALRKAPPGRRSRDGELFDADEVSLLAPREGEQDETPTAEEESRGRPAVIMAVGSIGLARVE